MSKRHMREMRGTWHLKPELWLGLRADTVSTRHSKVNGALYYKVRFPNGLLACFRLKDFFFLGIEYLEDLHSSDRLFALRNSFYHVQTSCKVLEPHTFLHCQVKWVQINPLD